MIKYLELALSQEVYEYLEELDEMNWSARGNVLNQYFRNTSIGTTVIRTEFAPLPAQMWCIFPRVIQINTKFANFRGLYFPHFTTFHGQTLQFY